MAWNVHLQVSFAADNHDGIAALASKHQADNKEAQWFLSELSQRSGTNTGPRGGVCQWGMVGNHTNVEAFVEALKPFWKELLKGVEGGPLDFEHIIVLYEVEQSEAANAYEIFLEKGELVVKHHPDLPFCWGQF